MRLVYRVSTVLVLRPVLIGCNGGPGEASKEETTATETATADDTTTDITNPARLTNLGQAVSPVFSPNGH